MTDLETLLAEFRAEFEAGSQPDPGRFLARAGAADRVALAKLIDAYLDQAPPKPWDPDAYERSPTRAAVERYFETVEGEAGTWPELLPALRNRARIRRSELVERLAAALGFPAESERVGAYYHRMEHGRLAAANVSDTVLEKLAGIVGTTRERLRAAGEGLAETAAGELGAGFARTAFSDREYMAADAGDVAAGPAPAQPSPAETGGERRERTGELDDLDRLFLGG